MSSAIERARTEDNGRHAPSASPDWQESALFNWFDPANGRAGFYRIGTFPNRGASDLYTWTQVDGRFVDRRKSVDLPPVPDNRVTDCECEGVSFRTNTPLESYTVRVERPALSLELEWTPHVPPMSLNLASPGQIVARGHYNTVGRAVGEGRAGEQAFSIDGVGFMDHSWGERRGIPGATRWLIAVFDPGFFVMMLQNMTDRGPVVKASYMLRDGDLRLLTNECRVNMTIADDGYSPLACAAEIHDEDGRHLSIEGRVVGPTSVMPYQNGAFLSHGPARFSCGDRQGSGILEASANYFGLPRWEIDALDLAGKDYWLAP